MEAVEFVLSAIAGALVTIGLALMIRPAQMARIRRHADDRRPTTHEIMQKRILGVGLVAIGVFALYMIASHHPGRYCWCLAPAPNQPAGPVHFRQSADVSRIRLAD